MLPVAGSPIGHVVVVVQENRSTDNLFAASVLADGGPFPGADVSRSVEVGGKRIALRPVPLEDPGDPPHTHAALFGDWNGGALDGFGDLAYGYVPPAETAIYHLLAHRYALADRNFAPRFVPTFPSHLFLIAARSEFAGNPLQTVMWGCDAPPATRVITFGEGENVNSPGAYPCVDDRTIGDLLDAANVSWKYYSGALGPLGNLELDGYEAIRHIRYGADWQKIAIAPAFFSDVRGCTLPAVSYIAPSYAASDHAGSDSNGGPAWVGSIYRAIVESDRATKPGCRYYGNTAILLTWDDSGGWFDHVAPPPGPDGTRRGFRIPIVAISAWSRSGYVSHTMRDSTSILRFIEKNWALGDLGARDATADDLGDLFDYRRARPVPPIAGEIQRRTDAMHVSFAWLENDPRPVDADDGE